MGESRERDGFFGKYTEHFDDDGNKIGESRERDGFFGKYTEHTDSAGNKTGESREREGFFGNYTEHTDSSASKTGESRERDGFFGHYTEHTDAHGEKVGESRERDGFFGKYTEHTGAGWFGKAANNTPSASSTSSDSDSYGQSLANNTAGGGSISSGAGWIFAFIAIGLVVWVTSNPSRTQRDKEVAILPPAIVISENACPFEGCQLGKWSAQQSVQVYDSIDGKIKNNIRAGELVNATYGEIRASPLKAIVTGTYKTDEEQGINIGSAIYVLHPIGEGAVAVWKNGKVLHGSLDLTFHYENSIDSQTLQWTWWVQVRFGDGTTGWLKNPQGQFAGMDALG